jgi:exodeoxyribonuclease VII large subunit
MKNDFITLSQLNGLIQEVFEMNFIEDIWLVAEIAELRVAGAGHCYLELVEKKGEKIVARIRANIWSYQYQRIANDFYAATGSKLQKGMKVLLSIGVSYHALYGISLVVKNIDTNYSLGDLERRKKEILEQLVKENLLDRNRALNLELVPKRIAVISSETAAGFGDFMNQIKNNENSYISTIELFKSIMQGDTLGSSIVGALIKIHERLNEFDCVVIIRGGGASLDLAGFDNYDLAKAVARFPLPVITGVGHERDDTVIDHVSYQKVKTPTAAADFILSKFSDFESYFEGLREGLIYFTKERVTRNKNLVKNLSFSLKNSTQKKVEYERLKLNKIESELPHKGRAFLKGNSSKLLEFGNKIAKGQAVLVARENQKINLLKQRLIFTPKKFLSNKRSEIGIHNKTLKLLHPDNVLNRGYALVYKANSIVTKSRKLQEGDEIKVKMKDGIIKSKIIKNGE